MRSLWVRVWLAALASTIVPIVLIMLAAALVIQRQTVSADIRGLERQALVLAAIVKDAAPDDRQTVIDAVATTDRQLALVAPADLAARLSPEAARDYFENGQASGRMTTAAGASIFAAREMGGRVLVVTRPYDDPILDWRPWSATVVWAALAAVVCAGVASLIVARAITRPVRRVARMAETLAAGRPPLPVPERGAAELQALAGSFNRMVNELDRSREAERAFLLSVSHELKTPIAAIQGYAEGERDGVIPHDVAGRFILAESERLERLVRDILDLARLNRPEFFIKSESIDLGSLVAGVAERFSVAAADGSVELNADVRLAHPVIADRDRLVQVLSNLIENALRCTPAGGSVLVVAERNTVKVVDTGPGLAPEDIPRAFERFYLYRRYRDTREAGTGLGLALVSDLVHAMGGSVGVSSEPGAGATFSFELPSAAVGGAPTPAHSQSGGR